MRSLPAALLLPTLLLSTGLLSPTVAYRPHPQPTVGVEALSIVDSSCQTIQPSDGLLIIDVQNDFMESTPLQPDKKPLNPIPPEALTPDGKHIIGGSLGVTNSSQIINPINQWIDLFTTSGARIFASLDWHPKGHCSYCRNGTAKSNPKYYHPHGAVCGPEGKDTPDFNFTGRCDDDVAVQAFKKDNLMQWPDHCVQNQFGSKFHPYLNINPSVEVVKKGYQSEKDSYSAFGGSQSVQGFPFDVKDSASNLIGQPSLASLLEAQDSKAQGVKRLFVMGLAVDYCVLHSTLDALGMDPSSHRPRPAGIQQVVLVEGAARGVAPATTEVAIKQMKTAGAIIAPTAAPKDTLKAVCHHS